MSKRQARFLFSGGSPLTSREKERLADEIRKGDVSLKSPPAGVKAFNTNPRAAGDKPSVPKSHTNLPVSVSIDKADVPADDAHPNAAGMPSDVKKAGTPLSHTSPVRKRGPEPVRSFKLVDRVPADVQSYENVPEKE